MRKINTRNFHLATRTTTREVNRRIVLNLIREYQPISRAELARRMNVRRGSVTPLVKELVDSGAVLETGAASVVRGRRPTMLTVRTSGRLILAADVRPATTFVALADLSGRLVARAECETPGTPEALVEALAACAEALLERHAAQTGDRVECQGFGLVVPGMIDRKSGRLIYSPLLGWRDVNLRASLGERLGLRVFLESAPIACALARLWLAPDATRNVNSFAYVHVSDGVGVGLVVNGEPLRGDMHQAGEFGHIPLDSAGPLCSCGKRGCWEALAKNPATVARYATDAAGGTATMGSRQAPPADIGEVLRRAEQRDEAAVEALVETGRHIGRGLALVVTAFNPGRIYLGGEITAAWDILEGPIRETLAAGALTPAAGSTPVIPDGSPAEYRLQGAVALVTAPTFAALAVG